MTTQNKKTINITCKEDLYGESVDDIWEYICNLNRSLDIKTKLCDRFESNYHYRSNEWDNICENMKNKITILKNELTKCATFVGHQCKYESGSYIRDLCERAEMMAIFKVFPNATKPPYCIRSFPDLVKFIEDPEQATKDGLCLSGAK